MLDERDVERRCSRNEASELHSEVDVNVNADADADVNVNVNVNVNADANADAPDTSLRPVDAVSPTNGIVQADAQAQVGVNVPASTTAGFDGADARLDMPASRSRSQPVQLVLQRHAGTKTAVVYVCVCSLLNWIPKHRGQDEGERQHQHLRQHHDLHLHHYERQHQHLRQRQLQQ
ncbi:hypothetical protein ATCC90586_011169 [Pythium insidiosum]|nr:hypothetical protein ATCC90586_011169 [Pythium insidiosum]